MAVCNLTDVESEETGPGTRMYTATWEFQSDTVIRPKKALFTARRTEPDKVPVLYSSYQLETPSDLSVFLKRLHVKRDDPIQAKKKWTIIGRYLQLDPGEDVARQQEPNPLKRSARYWLESDVETEPVEKAFLQTKLTRARGGLPIDIGKIVPIINAAGHVIDTPLLEDVHRSVLAIQKNWRGMNDLHRINRLFHSTTNLDTYFGYPQDHVQYLWTDSGEPMIENSISFYTGVTRIALSAKPMYRGVVNEGFEELVGIVGQAPPASELRHMRDKEGEKISEPRLLGLDGLELPKDTLGTTIDYRTKPRVSYQGLIIR